MHVMHDPSRPAARAMLHRRRGITIVELLVVVGIIVVLVGLLIVGLSSAASAAQSAKTQALMSSINQAMSIFEKDHGYLPPTLDNNRGLLAPPVFTGPADFNNAAFVQNLQDWGSMTTLADYLLGYGSAAQDGVNGPGIRSPGSDRFWGGAAAGGLLTNRAPITTGRIYGTYLELADNALLGSFNPADLASTTPFNPTFRVYLPGEANYDNTNHHRTIVDYWGRPILYFEKHPRREVSLAEVIVLRPAEASSGSAINSPVRDASNGAVASLDLRSAKFGLLSLGPDRTGNQFLRFDNPDDPNNASGTVFANRDNIVEIGR